jgi:sugar/nucleoside kinase (ribokinase family)
MDISAILMAGALPKLSGVLKARSSMPASYDVAAIGNAIVDVISPCSEAFLDAEGLAKGAMLLIDEGRAHALYASMAPGMETSGGSAANTVAGVASFGGTAAYMGKVADDQLGAVFTHDMNAGGVAFSTPPLVGGPATARSLINITPDGQRAMSTFLGASVHLTPADVDAAMIKGAHAVYLEGYLFDAPDARAAFAKAAEIARDAGRLIAMTLSDIFVVERHRAGLNAFIDSDIDLVFANEAELLALFETTDFDAAAIALAKQVKIAAITRGEHGSVVLSDGRLETVKAAPIAQVIDTTGAGDQYAAGFLFGLARGRPLAECAKLGHIAAGEVISHYGPRPQTSLKELAFVA